MGYHPTIADMAFLGLNGRVVAVDRQTGQVAWDRTVSRWGTYVSVLLDGDRLLVGTKGEIHCLDPLTGRHLWQNPLKGYGYGVMAIATVRGSTGAQALMQADADQRSAAASGAASG